MISLGQRVQNPPSIEKIDLNLTLSALKKEIQSYQSPAFLVRAKLKNACDNLDEAFWHGANVDQCLRQRALIVEDVLKLGYLWYELNTLPVCLIAVGGFGRGQLHPHSDVDILILCETRLSKQQNHLIEHFIAYTWDCGLNVGHSVRTYEECVHLAQQDLTILSNLLDARMIIGLEPLFDALNIYTSKESKQDTSLEAFFDWKLQEREKRYQRFGHTEYTLEPNLKESPGGLRDIQLLGLFTKREFGTHDLDVLSTIGFITNEEKQTLSSSFFLLGQIRYALHLISEKREDRLYLDYQEKLARAFGFNEPQINDAISHFMLTYFRSVNDLREITSVLFQHFRELYQKQSASPKPLNQFSKIQGQSILITDEAYLIENPHDILILFEAIAQNPNLRGFVAKSTRFIRNYYQTHPLKPNTQTRPLFLKLFDHPKGCAKALRLMARFGLLAQYIPDFEHTIGQMQYDLYHVYTVDAHTLNMLENIQSFYTQKDQPAELLTPCLQENIQPICLYLGALFHDMAKGLGGNHSTLGSEIAEKFCKEHIIDEVLSKRIAWLVKEHLTLSSTARSQDLSDPDVIANFCNTVTSLDDLNHLYIMTVADIMATNPTLWNKWQDTLLASLYKNARHFLQAPSITESQEKIETSQNIALKMLKHDQLDEQKVKNIWQNLGNEYFQIETPETIVWHTKELYETPTDAYPIVALQPNPSVGGTEIFIFAPDRVHLFALCTATLDKLQLSVVQARIITSTDGFCMNTFVVLESTGQPISGPQRNLEIQHTLKALLAPLMQDETKAVQIPLVSHRIRRQLRFFKHQAQVSITNAEKPRQTVLVVKAPDFPGLLARIGEAFIACDVFVHSAKINTLGKRVEDIFYITDRQSGQPITSAESMLTLKSTILDKMSAYWA